MLVEGLHALLIGKGHGLLHQVISPFRIRSLTLGVSRSTSIAATLFVHGGYQPLGDDGLQVEGELHIYLEMSLNGEEIEYTFHGLIRVVRVEGGEREVACLREGNGVFHGLRVPDLPYEDHVRRLTEHVLQGIGEGMGIEAHLPLGNDAQSCVHGQIRWGLLW